MEVCVLASGSKGNSIYVAGAGTAILIDAGLSARALTARLQQADIAPETIAAVVVTHDHDDHCRGADVFCRKHRLRLFANEGTASGVEARYPRFSATWEIFETSSSFTIGGLSIEPFTIPHDAADPVGFVISDGLARLCVATDLGQATTLLKAKLATCHAAILESNHDYDMLMQSGRPWTLKTRVAGRSGHLSNDDAAEALAGVIPAQMHTLLLAHLSEECNTPELALRTMHRALLEAGRPDVKLAVLSQHEVSARFTI